MEWYAYIGLLLGSAVVVELIRLAGERMKRRDTVVDKQADINDIREKLTTDKARLDNHDRQIAALEAKQAHMSDILDGIRDGQVVTVRAIMVLLDGTENSKGAAEAKAVINQFLTEKIGAPRT